MDSETRESRPVEAGKTERRAPRSIRFRDAEWERIEDCAEKHSMAAAEFVRFAALSAVEDGGEACKRLAPLIETTFRAAHIMVTKMRTDMLDEDRGDELDELIESARALQDRLLGREPAEGSGN